MFNEACTRGSPELGAHYSFLDACPTPHRPKIQIEPSLVARYKKNGRLRSIKSVPLTWSGIRASARMHTRRPAISIDMTVFINALRGLAGFSRIPTQNLPTTISFFNSLYPLGCLYQPHTTVKSMSLNFQRNEPRPRPCRNFFSSKIRTHYSMSPN